MRSWPLMLLATVWLLWEHIARSKWCEKFSRRALLTTPNARALDTRRGLQGPPFVEPHGSFAAVQSPMERAGQQAYTYQHFGAESLPQARERHCRSKAISASVVRPPKLHWELKGRSSSRALNSELKRLLGPALGGDIYGLHTYYDTAFNPADDPTRNQELQSPCESEPFCWEVVRERRTFEFEHWLRRDHVADDFAV